MRYMTDRAKHKHVTEIVDFIVIVKREVSKEMFMTTTNLGCFCAKHWLGEGLSYSV